MKTRTAYDPQLRTVSFGHTDEFVCLGSCFAEHIGSHLLKAKFKTLVNPLGIIYNPVSISRILQPNLELHRDEFVRVHERWLHHGLHSSLYAESREGLTNTALGKHQTLRSALERASAVIITLGTAWVHTLLEDGTIVANCHKQPANRFEKRLLSHPELVKAIQEIKTVLRSIRPKIQIIWTVSPIRHIREGHIHNLNSKASLIAALHSVITNDNDCHYFPAYELMMDDLRDYRYYEADMIHPSAVAIDYIWDIFRQEFISPLSQGVIAQIDKVNRAISHRPFHPGSGSHLAFLKKIAEDIKRIESTYEVDLSTDRRSIDETIKQYE
ncbi:MAG: GSCFA domain-containing protein [Bacteroidota bacterium]